MIPPRSALTGEEQAVVMAYKYVSRHPLLAIIRRLDAEVFAQAAKHADCCVDRQELAALTAQVEALWGEIRWLDEFVVEPDWFPNGGDRQAWQERRRAALARAIVEGKE